MCAHMYTCMHMHGRMHTHVDALCVQCTHMHTCMTTCTHVCEHTHMHAHMCRHRHMMRTHARTVLFLLNRFFGTNLLETITRQTM